MLVPAGLPLTHSLTPVTRRAHAFGHGCGSNRTSPGDLEPQHATEVQVRCINQVAFKPAQYVTQTERRAANAHQQLSTQTTLGVSAVKAGPAAPAPPHMPA
jgi:hypothetical protein